MSYPGARIGSMSLNMTQGAIVTGQFDVLALNEVPGGATVGTGAANAAPTGDVVNAVDNIANVQEGGSAFTGDVDSITLQVSNNLRAQNAIGSAQAIGIGLGRFNVSGTFRAYFESRTLYEKYTDFTASDLSFDITDAAGNRYSIQVPRLKFGDGQVLTPGNDQDVYAELTFTGIRDSSTDAMLIIDRDPA